MEYWRHNEQFHSCLTCCFISPFALVFSSHPLLIITVINVSDAAHITINNNNNNSTSQIYERKKETKLVWLKLHTGSAVLMLTQNSLWLLVSQRKTELTLTHTLQPQVHSLPVSSHSQQQHSYCCLIDYLKNWASLSREAPLISRNVLLKHSIPNLLINNMEIQNSGRWPTQKQIMMQYNIPKYEKPHCISKGQLSNETFISSHLLYPAAGSDRSVLLMVVSKTPANLWSCHQLWGICRETFQNIFKVYSDCVRFIVATQRFNNHLR